MGVYMKKTLVRDVMSTEPVFTNSDMALTDLVKLFVTYQVRGLPVVGEDGRLLGVVTETDLFLKKKGVAFSIERVPTLLGQVVDPDEVERLDLCRSVTVGEVMTESPVSIGPDESLWDAAQLMSERRFSILPVTADGTWLGTVRRIFLLRRIYAPTAPS